MSKKILLTSLKPYHTYQEVVRYMREIGATALINNTVSDPPQVEYAVEDIPYVWDKLRFRLSIYLTARN